MTNLRVLKNNELLTINGPEVKSVIEKHLSGSFAEFKEVTVIFMNKVATQHKSGKTVLHILFGATPGDITSETEVNEIASLPTEGAKRLEFEQSAYAVPMFDNHIYYSQKHSEVYVPYDLTGMNQDAITPLVESIVQFIRTDIVDEIVNVDSWTRTKDKVSLHNRINEYFKRDIDRSIRDKEEHLSNKEQRLESVRQEFATLASQIKPLMAELDALRRGEVEGIDAFMEGLDLIAQHPRVENLTVKESMIEIFVPKVIARVRIDRKDRFFNMGDMTIKIDIKRCKVRFSGTERHRSYWSSKDFHPHISSEGNACLGNIETTVLELSQQLEIYPLYLICLDFIQSVNLDDTAGRNVYNWTEVQEDGSPLVEEEVEVEEVEQPQVKVLMDTDGNFDEMTDDEAKAIATYVAYPQYIGYVFNENLETVEAFLSEGGEV